MNVLLIIGAVIIGGFVLICALVGFGHLTRGTPVSRVRFLDDSAPPAVASPHFCEIIRVVAGAEMRCGNAAEVLTDGGTYDRLFADLRAARQSITIHLYYCQPGRMADRFQEILLERARAGVEVFFLCDAFGSKELPREYLERLEEGGARVRVFRPTHWYELHKAQHRSHTRVIVIDGRVAYTGGFGIDDKWFGDGRTDDSWRDTNVRFTGPAVAQHQAIFVAGWAEAAGDLVASERLFPPPPDDRSGILAASVHAAPTAGSTVSERLLALTIAGARRRLYISNSYFVPDDDFCRLLAGAAGRGTDVRVLTASLAKIDTKLTGYASHARYDELLAGGVRIYEYQPSMMHAKTIVADGIWSIIGSMNFDNRSFALNDESVLVAHDGSLAATIERLFADDLKRAREITLPEWRRRPRRERLLERGAALFSRLL
jgi:cardiolipin synthase